MMGDDDNPEQHELCKTCINWRGTCTAIGGETEIIYTITKNECTGYKPLEDSLRYYIEKEIKKLRDQHKKEKQRRDDINAELWATITDHIERINGIRERLDTIIDNPVLGDGIPEDARQVQGLKQLWKRHADMDDNVCDLQERLDEHAKQISSNRDEINNLHEKVMFKIEERLDVIEGRLEKKSCTHPRRFMIQYDENNNKLDEPLFKCLDCDEWIDDPPRQVPEPDVLKQYERVQLYCKNCTRESMLDCDGCEDFSLFDPDPSKIESPRGDPPARKLAKDIPNKFSTISFEHGGKRHRFMVARDNYLNRRAKKVAALKEELKLRTELHVTLSDNFDIMRNEKDEKITVLEQELADKKKQLQIWKDHGVDPETKSKIDELEKDRDDWERRYLEAEETMYTKQSYQLMVDRLTKERNDFQYKYKNSKMYYDIAVKDIETLEEEKQDWINKHGDIHKERDEYKEKFDQMCSYESKEMIKLKEDARKWNKMEGNVAVLDTIDGIERVINRDVYFEKLDNAAKWVAFKANQGYCSKDCNKAAVVDAIAAKYLLVIAAKECVEGCPFEDYSDEYPCQACAALVRELFGGMLAPVLKSKEESDDGKEK